MKGNEFKQLCKVLALFDDVAPMTKEVRMVDANHVILMIAIIVYWLVVSA